MLKAIALPSGTLLATIGLAGSALAIYFLC